MEAPTGVEPLVLVRVHRFIWLELLRAFNPKRLSLSRAFTMFCLVLACSNPGPDCLTYQRAPAAFDAQLAGIIMAMTTEPAIGPNITIFPMALAEPTEGAAAQGNNQTGAATAGQFNSPELQRLLEPFRPTAELEYSVLTGAPGYGFWRLQAAALPIGSSGPLVSALLYGRVFRLDDLSYDCPVPE
eukprot:SAG31_NODE_2696_length_5228_cov_2.063365_2_plen_186_part_00